MRVSRDRTPDVAACDPAASRVPHLDGIRGVAVLLVLTHHSPVARFVPFGWTGVDLFFVLSGFLITRILLAARDQPKYFRNFYARRALRIWPLYYAFVLFAFGLAPLLFPSLSAMDDGTLPAFLLYVQNLSAATITAGPVILGMTWSLAIEEQFYMAWPLAVRFVSARTLRLGAIATLVASPLLRYTLMQRGATHEAVYWGTFTHLDGLAAGTFIALSLPELVRQARRTAAVGGLLAGVALPAAFAVASVGYGAELERGNPLMNASVYSLLAIGFAGLLAATLVTPQLARPFAARWLRYVGKVSYGLYLYHYVLVLVAGLVVQPWVIAHTGLSPAIVKAAKWVVVLPLMFVAAEASWRWFEAPILRLKSRFEGAAAAGDVRPAG